jgi:HAD superfamily hydrolase (TIGR01484 family)
MRYHVLACDYDGTLAHDGRVAEPTLDAIRRLSETGRKLVLVTGRRLEDLVEVFPDVSLFARVVAENGAVVYRPDTKETRVLHDPVPEALVDVLRAAGVVPLDRGRVIVATWQPWDTTVLRAIQTLGLELQVIFNKGAVMVLPPGVNKATGLVAALGDLKISAHNCVGVGDAENDHAFLTQCECAVAVANALPMLKATADLVTAEANGMGTLELVERLLRSDLAELEPRLSRHMISLGTTATAEEVPIPPYGASVLIAGPSGSGKSTLATSIMERLVERHYQICVVDPEGDYVALPGAIVLGDQKRVPSADEILKVLDAPDRHVVVNLLGVPLKDRPAFFAALLPRLQELRARVGRPHWLVVDEAHHLFLPERDHATLMPKTLTDVILITVHPEHVAPAVLTGVSVVLGVGGSGEDAIRGFCTATGRSIPRGSPTPLAPGEALYWSPAGTGAPITFRIAPARAERQRHVRKYAEGELGPDRSFYFRGPDDRLNLRAQNLAVFVQLADGVDDDTWRYHLRNGHYSRWFREAIKNDGLADDAVAIEREDDLPARESRARIRAAIEQRYTLPA